MAIFSIPISEAIVAIVSATATGEVTVASNASLWPGALAWLIKTDGTRLRVLIVKRISTDKIQVRKAADGTEQNVPAPTYGYVDASAFNTNSTICQEAQTAPVTSDLLPRLI